MSRQLAIAAGLALVGGTIAACGPAPPATVEEVNSAVPPLTTHLEAHLEGHFEKANAVSDLRCRQTHTETPSLSLWECRATKVPDGRPFEVELLVNGADGSYEIAECRTGPEQPYSQEPRGVCKAIH
jgi:hypothetical protein